MPSQFPSFDAVILRWTRFHWDQSTALYRTWSGADKPNAERERLVACALRTIHRGIPIDTVMIWYRIEWSLFMVEQNRKVDAAPKIRSGPSAGQSVIGYYHAAPCSGDQGELDILRHVREAINAAADDI